MSHLPRRIVATADRKKPEPCGWQGAWRGVGATSHASAAAHPPPVSPTHPPASSRHKTNTYESRREQLHASGSFEFTLLLLFLASFFFFFLPISGFSFPNTLWCKVNCLSEVELLPGTYAFVSQHDGLENLLLRCCVSFCCLRLICWAVRPLPRGAEVAGVMEESGFWSQSQRDVCLILISRLLWWVLGLFLNSSKHLWISWSK